MLAIDEGRPETMNLKQILNTFLEFQYQNMTKKYNVLLEKELEKKEVQEGLIEACDVIDLIIAVLRGSKNMKDAKECLMTGNTEKIKFRVPGFEEDAKNLHFTERQATAILEMRLYKLIGLEILALQKSYKETLRKIREYQHILSNQKNMDVVIKEDLDAIKAEFAEPRRTQGAHALKTVPKLFMWKMKFPFRKLFSLWTASATARRWTAPSMRETRKRWTARMSASSR